MIQKKITPINVFFHRAAVACVGAFYEKMGRMLGSSFPETVNNLLKSLKSAEVSFLLYHTYVVLIQFKLTPASSTGICRNAWVVCLLPRKMQIAYVISIKLNMCMYFYCRQFRVLSYEC